MVTFDDILFLQQRGNESFEYLIADMYNPVLDIPEGFITKTIPAFEWAVFPCKGAMPEALQDVNTKIFSEWLPALKEYEFAAGYCIEMYDDPTKYANGTMDENYYCEIWIPVKKNEKYQKLMDIFWDYENQNLYETAVKGITGFFQYYDLQFAPQNTIITMDYPTLYRDFSLTGIDAIAKYVDELYLEQVFLQSIPRQYVLQILQEYDVDYRKAFYNISTIIVRHFVAKAVVKGMQREDEVEIDEILLEYSRQSTLDSLESTFLHMFGELVKTICEEEWRKDIMEYYTKDIKEFALELQQVKDSQYIKNVVVIEF